MGLGPKYETTVVIQLKGPSGNGIVIVGLVEGALRSAGASNDEIATYARDAMSEDYDHLLAVSRQWVDLVTV